MIGRREFCLGATGLMTVIGGRARAAHVHIEAIDTHAHIFLKSLPMAAGRRYAPDYDASLETYLATLATHGVDRGVLVQPSFLGTDNSYLVSALERHSEKLRGIAVVPITARREELEALNRSGIVGIRLNLIGQPVPDFATSEWTTHLSRLASLGWLVEVQVEAARLPAVAPAISNAGLKLVVDHFGRPDALQGLADPGFRFLQKLGRAGNTWVKLSGAYRLAPGPAGDVLALEAAAALHDHFGGSRLMWGSDWPHTQFEKVASYSAARAALDRWIPNERERRRILVDTPRTLFGFATRERSAVHTDSTGR